MHLISGTTEIAVLSATITWSQRGPWVADLILDATEAPSGSVTIEQGSVRLRGTVSSSGAFAGRASARVVAGAGGLSTPVQAPRQYRSAPLSLILSDLGADAGGEVIRAATEALGATVMAPPSGGGEDCWARPAAAPARVLDELCAALGADNAWRSTDSGSVALGPETWPAASPRAARILDEDTLSDVLTVDDELLELRPGTTWDGRRLSVVQVQWSAQRTRTKVWVSRGTGRGLGDALARAVEAWLPSPLWTRLHPAKVHSQDSDRSVQVIPDDGAVPPMIGVPLRTGIPGLDLEVNQGARVLVGFEDGDPRRPFALPAFDRDLSALRAIRVTADYEVTVDAPTVRICDNGGDLLLGDAPANPVARVGDIVQVAISLVVPDPTQGIALTSPSGPVTGTIGTPVVPAIAVGQILSGKGTVLA